MLFFQFIAPLSTLTVAVAVALAAAWACALASPPPHTLAVAEETAEATAELSWEKPPAEEDALDEQAAWTGRESRGAWQGQVISQAQV